LPAAATDLAEPVGFEDAADFAAGAPTPTSRPSPPKMFETLDLG